MLAPLRDSAAGDGTADLARLAGLAKELRAAGRRIKDPIQRYKGLGEMDAKQLRETTMDPALRTLRRVQVGDAEAAGDIFDLLMGKDVDPRKQFLFEGAATLGRARIDV